jgi:hypothetical protein
MTDNREQNQEQSRIGREPTVDERTVQLLRENLAARDRAAFNHWVSVKGLVERDAAALWRAMTDTEKEVHIDAMFDALSDYHALTPAERALVNRGALKVTLEANAAAMDAALNSGAPDGGGQ